MPICKGRIDDGSKCGKTVADDPCSQTEDTSSRDSIAYLLEN